MARPTNQCSDEAAARSERILPQRPPGVPGREDDARRRRGRWTRDYSTAPPFPPARLPAAIWRESAANAGVRLSPARFGADDDRGPISLVQGAPPAALARGSGHGRGLGCTPPPGTADAAQGGRLKAGRAEIRLPRCGGE